MKELKFTIDHGIPIPPKIDNRGITETMRHLQIGDSFLVTMKASRTGLYVMARNAGIRITVRAQQPGGIGGQRIWRIA